MATVIIEEEVAKGQADVDSVDIGQLRPIGGCCCAISSLYCNGKNTCGCDSEGTLLCFTGHMMACKPSQDEDIWCVCLKSEVNFAKPTTCVSCSEQLFCVDTRCALPCNEKVPCILNLYGLTCMYNKQCKVKCCNTLAQIDPEYSHEKELNIAYGAPESLVATR